MTLKKWLLKYYIERYGVRKIAKDIGISEKSLDRFITAHGKLGRRNRAKVVDWLGRRRYANYTQKEFKQRVKPYVKEASRGITSAERIRLRKLYKQRATAKPRFRRIKKSLIREEAKRKTMPKLAKELGVKQKELKNLLKYPYTVFLPKKADVDKYLKYQKEYYDSKRSQVISSAKKLSKTKYKKYKVFSDKNVKYFTSGIPYAVVYLPVNSSWISVSDDPRTFDRLARKTYDMAMRNRAFRKYSPFVGSIFGKITFESIDDRDKLKWTVHESAPEVSVDNYNTLKSEMFGMIDYLTQLSEIFLEGKEGYNHVRIVSISIYMKFKDDYNVLELRSKRRV